MSTKTIGTLFGFTAAAAGLAALILPPEWVFSAWCGVFALVLGIHAHQSGWAVFSVLLGYSRVLDYLVPVIKRGSGEDVFILASYNVSDQIKDHEYMIETEHMIRAARFDSYRRVVVLRTTGDLESCIELLRRNGDKTGWSLAVRGHNAGLSINMLTISPSTVVFGLPKGSLPTSPDGDAIGMGFRNKTVYGATRSLVNEIWTESFIIKDNVALDPSSIEECIVRLRDFARRHAEDNS